MPTRFKKTRKLRGHVSAGHGRVGKHRKHPGGRGNAGAEHHHRIHTVKYHPGYIGKRGMRNFHAKPNRDYKRFVNVDELWGLIGEDARQYFKNHPDEKPIVDVTRVGINLVMGRTREPVPAPIIVYSRSFTKKAIEKIEAAGGECIVLGKSPEVCAAISSQA